MFRHALLASPMFYNHGVLATLHWGDFLTTDFHGFSRIFAMLHLVFLSTDFTDFTDIATRDWGVFLTTDFHGFY